MVVIWHECILDVADVQADYLTEDFVFLFFLWSTLDDLWKILTPKLFHDTGDISSGWPLINGFDTSIYQSIPFILPP